MKKTLILIVLFALAFILLLLLCLWDEEFKYLIFWVLHLIPVAIIGASIWYFGRHRVRWGSFDFLILIMPFLVYLLTALCLPQIKKGMGNLVEPLWLGCSLPLSPILRVIAGKRIGSATLSICLLVLLCMLAVALYVFVPALE